MSSKTPSQSRRRGILGPLLLMLLCCIGSPRVFAQLGLDLDVSGYLRGRAACLEVRDSTAFNPDSVLYSTSPRLYQAYALLRADLPKPGWRLHLQARPFYQADSTHSSKLEWDELYLDFQVDPATFLFVGRRNLVSGVAYATNPTDFLGENKTVDLTLDEDERRELRNGTDLVGIQRYFEAGTFSLVAVPRIAGNQQQQEKLLLSYERVLAATNADMVVSLLASDERPGLGLNLSATLGDSLVAYTETALRRGRDRSQVTAGTVEPGSRNQWVLNTVIGAQYTFTDATNLILEYQYDGNGFSDREWASIRSSAEGFISQIQDGGPSAAAAIGGLAQLDALAERNSLRRNYLFGRISHPKVLPNTEGSLLWLENLDDASGLARARLTRMLKGSYRLGLMVERMYGGAWSEFGGKPWKQAWWLAVTRYF